MSGCRRACRSRTCRSPADLSPTLDGLKQELVALWSVAPNSPQHFLAASPRIPIDPAITAYAQAWVNMPLRCRRRALALCLKIHDDFSYDKDATKVNTARWRRSR